MVLSTTSVFFKYNCAIFTDFYLYLIPTPLAVAFSSPFPFSVTLLSAVFPLLLFSPPLERYILIQETYLKKTINNQYANLIEDGL